MEAGYDYDFELTVRIDERFTRTVARAEVEAVISRIPGVRSTGAGKFVFDSPTSRWMDITVETREADEFFGKALPASDQVNCVHLHIPASVRGSQKDKAYFELGLAIARDLGWVIYDDTDSGFPLGDDYLERHWPSKPPVKPWWKVF
jgi:hypothetical protein